MHPDRNGGRYHRPGMEVNGRAVMSGMSLEEVARATSSASYVGLPAEIAKIFSSEKFGRTRGVRQGVR